MIAESAIIVMESAMLAARTLAIVAGVLVIMDSFKIVTGIEHPAHHPQGNAIAWAIISISAIAGAAGFLYFGEITFGLTGSLWGKANALIVWGGTAIGLAYRAAIRSMRPALIARSAALFFLAGFFLSIAEAL